MEHEFIYIYMIVQVMNYKQMHWKIMERNVDVPVEKCVEEHRLLTFSDGRKKESEREKERSDAFCLPRFFPSANYEGSWRILSFHDPMKRKKRKRNGRGLQIQKDPVRSSGLASFRIKPEAGFDRSNRKLFVSSMAASKVWAALSFPA